MIKIINVPIECSSTRGVEEFTVNGSNEKCLGDRRNASLCGLRADHQKKDDAKGAWHTVGRHFLP